MSSSNQSRMLEVQIIVDHSNLLVAELESLLTLSADESWEVGQYYKPAPSASEQQRKFSRWAIREITSSLDDLPKAINSLTNRISAMEEKFLLLPSDARVSLTLFVNETNTVIGMGLEAETIKLLAKLNADFEMSLLIKNSS